MNAKLTLIAPLLAAMCFASLPPLLAGEQLSDAAIKQKLLGYWGNPRHAYLYQPNGVRSMCPRKDSTTTNKWDVRGGLYYEDGDAYRIVTLDARTFAYQGVGSDRTTYTYRRKTKKEAEGE